ncbi:MAG: glutamine synthetase beta-grasp domain-containing protein [Pirellulaceae bacterium]
MTPREVLALCREKDVKAVDLRFCDLLGSWQHFTLPVGKLDEGVFEDGLGFDGARPRGWQSVHESDLLALPQSDTAHLDPFAATPTLALICNVQDPVTGEPYSRDPRQIAIKAANYLKLTGLADVAQIGLEAEFYVFDEARFDGKAHEPPLPTADRLTDLRSEMVQAMLDCGLDVGAHWQTGTAAGQCAIDLRFQPLAKMADWMMIYKHSVRSVARRHGQMATFMPQPLAGDNGSGMHTHLSFWKDDEPLFSGGGYAGLSELALHALGGILRHAPALLALTNPTTNSYKRLAPGSDAPANLVYSQRNRSAACRIPLASQSPKTRRIEFRCPDPTANPYLAFSAIVMAAIDGIQLKLNPGQPVDRDLYHQAKQESAEFPQTPASLDEALLALERDSDFLLRDDVFTPDVIETWIRHKRQHEIAPLQRRPHPYEFQMYFDA